jgi:hypothetical protein
MPVTVRDLVARAIAAHEGLAVVAEPLEEEWQYVADLGAAWGARLRRVADERGSEPAPAAAEAAVERVAEEAGLVTDPHRAIDWLSTLPQVVLLALGEGA